MKLNKLEAMFNKRYADNVKLSRDLYLVNRKNIPILELAQSVSGIIRYDKKRGK